MSKSSGSGGMSKGGMSKSRRRTCLFAITPMQCFFVVVFSLRIYFLLRCALHFFPLFFGRLSNVRIAGSRDLEERDGAMSERRTTTMVVGYLQRWWW